jgi:hypothetical protein
MDNFIFYGDWQISWLSVEKGWTLYVSFVSPKFNTEKLEYLKLEVGFFRDLAKGVTSCKHLIGLCDIEQQRTVRELVAKYSRNRHDQSKTISEILGRDKNSSEEPKI